MKLIGVSMVSNEADVIEAFVRHNLAFLDALVVLDHASVDPTPDILASLAREGLPLVLLRDPERAFRQGERITAMARRYLVEHGAQWCFALDADEFIRCPSRAALEAVLREVPAGVHGLVPLQNYVGLPAKSAQPCVLKRITRRLRVERAVARKVVIRRGFETLAAGQVSFGNHAVLQVIDAKVMPLPHLPLEGITHAHVPVRSPEQVARKALLGWLGTRLTRPERYTRPGQSVPSSHWKSLFERLARGEPIDESFLAEAIAAYVGGPVTDGELVDDPVSTTCELRYAGLAEAKPLAMLAAWADQLVSDVNARAAERTG